MLEGCPPGIGPDARPGVRPGSPAPTVPVAPTTAPPGAEPYYANCDAARAAGVAPILRGQPGYRDRLDGDGDGVACE
nr:excalibur calcium-binding domain-containing protein [Rhabdothermincola salaria]